MLAQLVAELVLKLPDLLALEGVLRELVLKLVDLLKLHREHFLEFV